MFNDVVIVAAGRTAVGAFSGALAGIPASELGAKVIKGLLARANLSAEQIDEVILGAANQAGEDNRDVARMAVLLAGLPHTVPGYTVNRLCASGLTAVANAASTIRSGRNIMTPLSLPSSKVNIPTRTSAAIISSNGTAAARRGVGARPTSQTSAATPARAAGHSARGRKPSAARAPMP